MLKLSRVGKGAHAARAPFNPCPSETCGSKLVWLVGIGWPDWYASTFDISFPDSILPEVDYSGLPLTSKPGL